ncbi:unnamed protein product [Porites lobata]|uniref:Uncharacterized protein n=1 Tax=Porites lobata TaxID=104759 RepID=A0ABN8RI58_9CNID|nr:unnamed protein product [Porites lobata]
MTICPYHRSSLGIGWRASSKLCCVPENVSGHSERGPLKAERGLSLRQSTKIYEVTNVLLPVGSGKVLNVFRPKIDCRVGGNSCSLPFKTTPLLTPSDRGFFAGDETASSSNVTEIKSLPADPITLGEQDKTQAAVVTSKRQSLYLPPEDSD